MLDTMLASIYVHVLYILGVVMHATMLASMYVHVYIFALNSNRLKDRKVENKTNRKVDI